MVVVRAQQLCGWGVGWGGGSGGVVNKNYLK